MSSVEIDGGTPLRGRLRVPGDKSISHRALLLAALADGTSHVTGLSDGDDVRHTAAAVDAMGAIRDGDRIRGGRERLHAVAGGAAIDVGNSGTGIRLLAGFTAPLPWRTVLQGDASVSSRPMGRIVDPLRLMGARIGDEYPPLTIDGGPLTGIDYAPPQASAQVKSAVLLAGLGADGETVVRERTETRRHTEELLRLADADVTVEGLTVRLKPTPLQPFELDVPGDPSQAAFWIVGALIVPGSDVTVEHVYLGPARNGFLDVLLRMGADLEVDHERGDIRARYSPDLHGTEVSGDEVPGLIDEIPVLAVAATAAAGVTVFRDAAELKVKETDRVATTVAMISALTGSAEPAVDGIIVHGTPGRLRPGRVESHGDHRIAMAGAIAGLAADGTTRIDGWDAVATSYPGFEEDLRACVS